MDAVDDLYIKMLSKADGRFAVILEVGCRVARLNGFVGVITAAKDKHGYYNVTSLKHGGTHKEKSNSLIYLPTQEDLQGMLFNNARDLDINELLPAFVEYSEHIANVACQTFTITQLWLDYTMRVLYCKTWDDEGWSDC